MKFVNKFFNKDDKNKGVIGPNDVVFSIILRLFNAFNLFCKSKFH